MTAIQFTDRVIQIIAEDKITAAIRAGEFDQLPGLGKPCALCDEPYEPNWWIRRKFVRENLGPKQALADLS